MGGLAAEVVWLGAGRGEDKEVHQRGKGQGQLCDQGVIWTPLRSCHSESGHNGGGGCSIVGFARCASYMLRKCLSSWKNLALWPLGRGGETFLL